jgi:hypothetical protein
MTSALRAASTLHLLMEYCLIRGRVQVRVVGAISPQFLLSSAARNQKRRHSNAMRAQHVRSHGGLFPETGNARRINLRAPSPGQGTENGFIPRSSGLFRGVSVCEYSSCLLPSDASSSIRNWAPCVNPPKE